MGAEVAHPLVALLCTTHAWGGIELNTLRLAQLLGDRGRRVVVVASAGSPLEREAAACGLPVLPLDNPRRYGDVASARRLRRMFADRGPVVLVANATRDLNLAVLVRGGFVWRHGGGPRLVVMQHMQIGVDKRDLMHRWHFARVDAWIAPLPSLAAQTLARTTMTEERVHVIPFGIDVDRFVVADAVARRVARQRLTLPLDVSLVGVIGRLDRGKGQEHLIEALALLAAEGRDVHVLIVGEDTRGEAQGYGDMLRQRVTERKLHERVHFRPFTQDVAGVLACLDVFALTSLAETYGMVTIEAMAAGLPIVATHSGGTPDIIREGETGLLVPPADPVALARALAALLDDKARAARVASAARADARERFSRDQSCDRYEEVFRLVVA